MVTGVLSVWDIHEEGGTLIVFMLFAILYTLSRQLDELGVMDYLGDHITRATHGLSWPAANFFSCVTPQGSSGNVIFVGSGYLRQKEVYRYGDMVTLANLLIFGVIGTAWILLLF